ncbi:polysaccharide biosynthesis tyrosine autokinase [Amycolatopsis sp. GM8]|uniref:polysaccharide biosynthesis tyrosine autokinase n=1 Tax=Amycolatopsis sp. GM8 TaxID=2896530 RepID=UPI001F022F28|nr:polysaccharide biosynthesis tyrosine autokinase [Amycolatopsis sp. GM8]
MARKRWAAILLGFLCGLGGAAVLVWRTPPEYAAQITIYVPAPEQRIDSYARLLTSDRIGQDVAGRLGLSIPGAEIARKLDASADQLLLTVTATDRSPVQAQRIADASGAAFTQLVEDLAQPAPGDRLVATVVAPAALPASPVSPDLSLDFALGALAGLVAGCGLALLREIRPRMVKTVDDLESLTRVPALGVLGDDPQAPRLPLTVRERPHSPQANAFRALRGNLQFVDVDSARKVITFTSALPEAGKTTLLCNLAIVLAAAGHQVVVVEADLVRPRLAGCLGLDKVPGLTSVLSGRVTLDRALRPSAGSLFDVLVAGAAPPDPRGLLASGRMRILLGELRCRYDMVLIEAPPLQPGTGAAVLVAECDGALLAVRHAKTTRRQIKAALAELGTTGARLYGTVLTMTPESAEDTAGADPQATIPLAAVARVPAGQVNGRKRERPAGGLPRNGAGHRR